MIRIGLIEDNIDYRDNLAFFLRREGFAIALEGDGRGIDQQLKANPCDVLLLDLGLPHEDGLTIARRLRAQHPAMGIVMLTARGSLDDRLTGLSDGADAYLVKPIEMRELIAIIKSLLRRIDIGVSIENRPADARPAWQLKPAEMLLVSPQGCSIKLTGREVKILSQMAQAYPQSISRQVMVDTDETTLTAMDFRHMEVALSRLRKKIKDATGHSLILASRNEGYLFGAPIRFFNDAK